MRFRRGIIASVSLATGALSAPAAASELSGASATAAALGGAQAGARDDASAPLANPAAMPAGSLRLGGALGSEFSRDSNHLPMARGALSLSLSERFRVGLGVGPAAYFGCPLGCAQTRGPSLQSYRVSLASSLTLLEDADGARLSLGVAYRPRLDSWGGSFGSSTTRAALFVDGVGASWGEVSLGALYLPFAELSIGVWVFGGGATTVAARTDSSAGPVVGSVTYQAPPQAALGAEFELDRFTARLDYSLVLSNLSSLVVVEGPSVPRESWGDVAAPVHQILLGLAYRMPVERSELVVRTGAGIATHDEARERTDSTFASPGAPLGHASVGAGLVGRHHELSLAGQVSTRLGSGPVPGTPGSSSATALQLAVDWTHRFDEL